MIALEAFDLNSGDDDDDGDNIQDMDEDDDGDGIANDGKIKLSWKIPLSKIVCP